MQVLEGCESMLKSHHVMILVGYMWLTNGDDDVALASPVGAALGRVHLAV